MVDKHSGFYIVIIPVDRKLQFKKLSKALSGGRIRMASQEEIYNLTGYRKGGVPPVGHSPATSVIVDQSLLSKKFVYGSASSPFHGLKVRLDDILRLSPAKVAEVSE